MSSVVITISSPKSQQTLINDIQQSSSLATAETVKLSNWFRSIGSGTESANITVNTSSASPVAASGTLTLTYASITANDTMVIGKTTLTWKTGAPANESEVRKITDLATTAENLVVAINAHSVLGNIVVASRVAGVVTITAKVKGEIGNQLPLSSSAAGAVASATYLASGAGGATGTAVSYSLGY
jgi:phage tail sheath gpL-like